MTYKEALNKAIGFANVTKRECGVLKLATNQFTAMILPNRENRYGSELRCELIEPGRTAE